MRTKLHTYIEKFTSMILRHSPETIGVEMSKEGWVNVNEFIKKSNNIGTLEGVVLTRELLEEVVRLSPKQRFVFSADGISIRANQGHSLENVKIDFKEITEVQDLFHGSTVTNIDSIQEKGLLKMSRHHVHLSPSINIAKQVGKRYGEVVIYKIDMESMLKDGFKFYQSENNVILVETVPSKYLTLLDLKNTPSFKKK